MNTIKKILFVGLFPTMFFAQQDSKIKIEEGNKNTVEVTQNGKDTLQNSDIILSKTDNNKIKVSQEIENKEEHKESTGFKSLTENTNNLFIALISIATFIGLVWKGFQHFKNKKEE